MKLQREESFIWIQWRLINMEIKVVRQILEWNEDCHKEVQKTLNDNNVKMINIMGSPGAGKTTFILNLINELKKKDVRVAVIEGDIEGTIDAKRIQDEGIPVVQLNTQGACHIEAMSIKNIINKFDYGSVLVCFSISNGEAGSPNLFFRLASFGLSSQAYRTLIGRGTLSLHTNTLFPSIIWAFAQ